MFDDIKKMLLDSLVETTKLAPAEITGRVYPEVLVTDMAPEGLKAAAGPDSLAYLVGTEPLQIEIPNVRGIYEVNPCDIIFEAAGGYEKAFRAAMKKYGIRTLSDLDTPAEKKGFYDFVDRVWHSKAEKEKGEEKGSHKDEGEFTDGLRDKHARDKDKMRDEKERAREKDQKAAEQDREQKKRETNEELPLYSDHQKAHKSEDKNDIIGEKRAEPYGVIKGDPKGKGEVVWKGNANKARSIVKALKAKGVQAYLINSRRAKVGTKVNYKKGHGFQLEELPLYSDYEKQHREGKKKLENNVEITEAIPRAKRASRSSVRGPVGVNYHGRPFRLLPKKVYNLIVLKSKKEGVEPKLGQSNTANMVVLQRIYNLGPSEVATAMKLAALKFGPDVFLTVDNEDGRRIGIGYSTDDNSTRSMDKRIQQDDLTLHKSIKDKLFKLIFGKELKRKNVEFDVNEVSPPARRHQAHGIKKHIGKKGKKGIPKTYVNKKTGKREKTNPFALAWAQYDKYGKPSSGPDKGSKTMKRIPKK